MPIYDIDIQNHINLGYKIHVLVIPSNCPPCKRQGLYMLQYMFISEDK